MSCRAVKDVGGQGTRKEGDVTKCLLDLTCLYGVENFRLSPVC